MQWDNDADLAYQLGPSGEDEVGALKPAFAAQGLTLQRNRTNAYWQVGTNKEGQAISPTHIDIFSYTREWIEEKGEARYVLGDPRFREEDPSSRNAECNTQYRTHELFPLRTVPFYDYQMKIPYKSEEVLARSLGADYGSVARIRAGSAGAISYVIRDKTPA